MSTYLLDDELLTNLKCLLIDSFMKLMRYFSFFLLAFRKLDRKKKHIISYLNMYIINNK